MTLGKKIILSVLVVIIVYVGFDNYLINKMREINVYKEYSAEMIGDAKKPLSEMMLNSPIKAVIKGEVNVSVDPNHYRSGLFSYKKVYRFIGEIVVGDYVVEYNTKNKLVSTELMENQNFKWYASFVSDSKIKIDNALYYLGVTITHDEDYQINYLSLLIFDLSKKLIGKVDFDIHTINPAHDEFTVEEKDKMYIDAMANAIENSIIQSYNGLKSVAVEIQKEDDLVSILVILDVDAQNEMKSSDIDEIEQFVLSTVFEGSEQHLKIVNQDGKRLD